MFTEVKQYLFLYKAEHNVKQNISYLNKESIYNTLFIQWGAYKMM